MEMLCAGVLIGLIVAMVVFACGVEYGVHQRKSDRHNNSGVHPDMGDNNDPAAMGDVHGKNMDRPPISMDSEKALIMLDCVKTDLGGLISVNEVAALEYAGECIEVRDKIENWLKEKGL